MALTTGNQTHPKVRPYVLTRGRTRPPISLLVHTLVSARYDATSAASLPQHARMLYEHAARRTRSVAELAATCHMALGVTRVLLGDMAKRGCIVIHADDTRPSHNVELLEKLRDGLRKLA